MIRPADKRQQTKRGRYLGAAAASAVGHLLILLALLSAWPHRPQSVGSPPIELAMVDWRRPPMAAQSPAPAAPVERRPRTIGRPVRLRRSVEPAPEPAALPSAKPGPGLDGDRLAGVATADSGPPDQACDMARRLQAALRKDPLVQTAVAGLDDRAVMVWNGDWVWIQGETGKGLAAVRQAMMWEIAFAPEACRSEPMRGPVILSSSEGQRSARLVVGSGEWRWSDLLIPHPGVAGDDPSSR